jgi:hypothetical protein
VPAHPAWLPVFGAVVFLFSAVFDFAAFSELVAAFEPATAFELGALRAESTLDACGGHAGCAHTLAVPHPLGCAIIGAMQAFAVPHPLCATIMDGETRFIRFADAGAATKKRTANELTRKGSLGLIISISLFNRALLSNGAFAVVSFKPTLNR